MDPRMVEVNISDEEGKTHYKNTIDVTSEEKTNDKNTKRIIDVNADTL